MRRLAKSFILATAVVSVIFLVDLSTAQAATEQTYPTEKIFPLNTNDKIYLDFWSKFRDTVMPDPDEPQDNNPPKETEPLPDESSPSEDEPEANT